MKNNTFGFQKSAFSHQINKLLYFFSGLCLFFFLFSCQKDEIDEKPTSVTEKSDYTVEKVNLKTFDYAQQATSLFRKINDNDVRAMRQSKKAKTDKVIVHTDEGVKVKKGNTHWLTFPISSVPARKNLENLVLKWDPETKTYTSFLVEYILTVEERQLLNEGKKLTGLSKNVKIRKLGKPAKKNNQLTSRGSCVVTHTYIELVPIYDEFGLIGYDRVTRSFTTFCGGGGGAGGTLNPGGIIVYNPPITTGGGIPDNYPNMPNTPDSPPNDSPGTGDNDTGNTSSPDPNPGGTYNPPTDHGGGGGNSDGNSSSGPTIATIPTMPENSNFELFLSTNTSEEQEWLAKPEQSIFRFQLKNFFLDNGYSLSSKFFGREAVEAKMNGGEVDWKQDIILDDSFVKNKKIKYAYDKLLEYGGLRQIIKGFYNEEIGIQLKFKVVSNLECQGKTGLAGCSRAIKVSGRLSNLVTVEIDEGYIAKNDILKGNVHDTPLLALVQTLIHESIHASLHLAVHTGSLPYDASFQALFAQYSAQEHWQHELMAAHYLGIISSALEKTHPFLDDERFINVYSNGYPDWNWHDFYYNLAWMGLSKTQAWETYKSNASNFDRYKEYLRKFITNSNSDVP